MKYKEEWSQGAEEKLRASEERYRDLLKSIDEGFCVIEVLFDDHGHPVDYRFLEINPTFERQTGLKQPTGKTALELVPDLDRSWINIYGQVALTGEPLRIEEHARAMNRWYDVFAFRVDRPEQHRVALLFNDISERKARELNAAFLAEIGSDLAHASDSREILTIVSRKLSSYLDVDSVAFVEIDDAANTGKVLYEWREQGCPSIGGTHHLDDFMSADFLNELRAGHTVAVSDVTTDPRTAGMVEAYNALGVRSHIQASYVNEGKWQFMLSVHSAEKREWREWEIELLRDLSAQVWLRLERAHAEESLRESERQARAFFDSSGVGAAQVGPDGVFRKVNDRYCQITGYTRAELLDMSPVELNHPDDREADREPFQRLLKERGFTYDVEKRYRRKDGRTIWVHVNARGVYDGKGNLQYTAAIVEDITDRKKAEQALRERERSLVELSHSLEQRVAERTAKYQEQAVRLRHMAAELASAEQRERKRLAALLHDDLQQFLVAATMRLNNLSRRIEKKADREAVEQAARWIGEATDAARDLTRQLRPPALYEGTLAAALHGLVSEMQERHHLKVTVEGGEITRRLSDDIKALVFESIRELLFNAAKYSGVDEAYVAVREDDNRLRVVVQDRGKGFNADTATQQRRNTGFGLFSIRERLAALGGEMKITSAPKQGTRIDLEVPMLLELSEELPATDEAPSLQETIQRELQGTNGIHRRHTRILVVDDHAMVREGLATVLDEDERLEVVAEAPDGVAAIEAVEHHRPDVILVDVNMPRMNGINAAREIHRRWPETIIIGLSVQDDEATAKAMRDAGASAFLPKAGDSHRMIATIMDLTGNADGSKQ